MTKRTKPKELRYTAVRKMSDAGMLPKSFATEADAVKPDAKKMLAIQRDLQRNSDVFNALITYLLTMVLGSDGAEILWRDERKDDLEIIWRSFIDHADITKRGSFLQTEIWTLTEYIVAGETLLILNDDSTVQLVESERIKEVEYDKNGVIQSFLITNGEDETTVNANDCLYIANWRRPSAVRGTPLFAQCVDNVNILSAIVRSIGLSWHKQAKIPLAVTTPGGMDDLRELARQDATTVQQDDSPQVDVIDTQESTIFVSKGTISGINQTVPSATFSDSVEAMVRLIASSAGLAGDSILNSFGNYSYSSARCAHMQTQGTIRRIQSQLVHSFYKPLIRWMLAKAGYRDVDFDVILPAVPVLDDLADAKAKELRLSLGIATYEETLKESNHNREEFLRQKKREVVDAINIAKEIEAETGIRVNYQQFCGVGQGKTEAAIVANNAANDNGENNEN